MNNICNFVFNPLFLCEQGFPWNFVSVISNFLIDSLLIVVLSLIYFRRVDGTLYKKTVFKAWGFGFLSDFAGVVTVFVSRFIIYDLVLKSQANLTLNYDFPDQNIQFPWNVITLTLGVVIAASLIFLFDYFFTFKTDMLTKKQRLVFSLCFAVFTAPYLFYLPADWIVGPIPL